MREIHVGIMRNYYVSSKNEGRNKIVFVCISHSIKEETR
jgi:hypothetical protein